LFTQHSVKFCIAALLGIWSVVRFGALNKIVENYCTGHEIAFARTALAYDVVKEYSNSAGKHFGRKTTTTIVGRLKST
jgi:hypothetical protein